MKNITKILLLFAALTLFGGIFKASAADHEKPLKATSQSVKGSYKIFSKTAKKEKRFTENSRSKAKKI
jgi:hypothetical protein